MSIALLSEVYGEVRRLAIAGSGLAGGDFRLKKLAPPLRKAAAKAPVFGKVADAVEKLVDGPPQDSADALLELNTLVSAILYTQGETGAEGKLDPIETSDFALSVTQTGARVLKPLIEALTGTGSGRQEIIVDAHQRGAFKDLRLIRPALQAIDDGYGEIADFVAEKVLPIYGNAIYDDLKGTYDPKGKGGAARRLRLMHRLDPEATRETVVQALDSGSKEVKLAALECLKGSRASIPYLLEQVKAKAAEIRQVALRCIAQFTDDTVVDSLIQALSGKDLALASQAASQNPSPKLLAFLLQEAEKQLDGLFAAGNKADAKARPGRFHSLLGCFASRRDKQSIAFLTRCFERREEIGRVKGDDCSGAEINRRVASLLVGTVSKPALKLVVDSHPTLDADLLDVALVAAIRTRKPSEVYELFSPYYLAEGAMKKKSHAAQKRECVRSLLANWSFRSANYADIDFDGEFFDTEDIPKDAQMDPRWLDAAVQAGDQELVRALARPGHKGACGLLSDAVAAILAKKGDMDYEVSGILEAMIRIGHPATVETYLDVIKKAAASKRGYYVYWLARLIPDLPPTAVEKLEALLPSLPEKIVDQLAPYVLELKAKAN